MQRPFRCSLFFNCMDRRCLHRPARSQVPTNETFNKTWAAAGGGVVHGFHSGFWGNNMFTVKSRADAGGMSKLIYDGGGFQMAQGSSGHRECAITSTTFR